MKTTGKKLSKFRYQNISPTHERDMRPFALVSIRSTSTFVFDERRMQRCMVNTRAIENIMNWGHTGDLFLNIFVTK